MFGSGEDGAAVASGWSTEEEKEDRERYWEDKFQTLVVVVLGWGVGACVPPADGPLCGESWGVGAQSFPCAGRGLFSIQHFTSVSPLSLFPPPSLPPSVVFAVVLSLRARLAFVNLCFLYKTDTL